MHHVDSAALVPAMCAFTKSAEGPFIDFGRDFDFDHVGRIYMREQYARELGAFCGLPSIAEFERARDELAAANAANDQLRSLVVEKNDRIDELERFRDEVAQAILAAPRDDVEAEATPAAEVRQGAAESTKRARRVGPQPKEKQR